MSVTVFAAERKHLESAARLVAQYGLAGPGTGGVEDDDLAKARAVVTRLLEPDHSATLLLAGARDRPTGFAVVSWGFSTSTGQPVLRVEALFTTPDARRRGVARALLTYCAAWGRKRGAHRLQLETDRDNEAARALYRGEGYEELPTKLTLMHFLT